MKQNLGTLYVVATPIGNLGDISQRALDCLKNCDVIAAEDTRHSRRLLDAYGIQSKMTALHEHNEASAGEKLVERLLAGEDVALVSDAGTPLISDPGQRFIPLAIEAGIPISPIPGASAATAALSAAGINPLPHWFEGFLPAKSGDRKKRLTSLASLNATLVFYEAPHRISSSLKDMSATLGANRSACVAREVTKKFETFHRGSLEELSQHFANSEDCRGEMVVIIEGAEKTSSGQQINSQQLLEKLLEQLPVKSAAKLTSEITGEHKNELYQLALELKSK